MAKIDHEIEYLIAHDLNMQPHLMRTKLCDMKDDELDPLYVKKREQLKELVASVIRPKIVQGKTLNGKEFVSFLEQVNLFIFDLVYSFMLWPDSNNFLSGN